ncbi:MAG: hypothetical protein ACE5HA_04515 [Anaerolineae bacterium]
MTGWRYLARLVTAATSIASLRRHGAAILTASVVFALLTGCGPSRPEIDSEQGRLDQAAPVIEGEMTVGQTFVANRDRLSAVEVLLVVYGQAGATNGEFTFHLRTDPDSPDDLVTRTFQTAEMMHNQTLRVAFDPLEDSSGRTYYFFFEGSAGSQVTVWTNTIDAYGGGSAVFAGQPQAGDLQFKTFYDYSLGMVAGDVMRGILRHGWLALPLAALLLLPGYLALLVAVPAEEWRAEAGGRLAPMLQVVLAVGLSVALVPLVLLFTTLVGFSLTPARLAGLLTLAAAGVVWQLWRLRWHPLAAWRARTNWPALGLFLGLLGVTLVVRLVQIRELVVPAWVDGVHHTMMTQLIVEQGRVPADYRPYLEIGPFIYHFGFHALAAGLAWLTGLSATRAVLVMGQVLNALVGVGVYGLTVVLLGAGAEGPFDGAQDRQRSGGAEVRRCRGARPHSSAPPLPHSPAPPLLRTSAQIAGLVALGVVGVVSLMPAYYVTWGRYTQLAGLVVLPAGVMLTEWWVEGGRRWALVLGGVAVAGLGLVHYRVLVFYGAYVAAMLAYRVGGRMVEAVRGWRRAEQAVGDSGGGATSYVVRVGVLAGLSLLLLSPWLMRLWAGLVPTGRGAGWLSGPAAFNAVPRALIDVGYDRVLLRLALLSLLLGLIWWRRASLLIGMWTAGAVLAANPNLIGHQETWLLSNAVLVITLFLPMSVLTGCLVGAALDAILVRLAGTRRRLISIVLAGIFSAGVLVAAWNTLDVVNPVTIVATKDDMTALDWIRHNTEPDAGFVTNIREWQYGTYMGADGGYWIPFLTGRRTLVPPALYSYGSREAYRRVQDVLDTMASISEAGDQRLTDLMTRHNLQYVYLGARGGQLNLRSFIDDPAYQMVYSNGPVWIFRIQPVRAGEKN